MLRSGTVHVEDGPIGSTLLAFALPVLASQLLQELYNVADCMVIGHFGGQYALAAAGIGGMLLSVFINFFVGFSSGVSVITAQLFGAYSYKKLKVMVAAVFLLALVMGLVMTAGGLLLGQGILGILHCPQEVRPDASLYLSICLTGLTAQMIYNTGTAVLRSMGDTRTPLLLFLGSTACNLALDIILVIGLDMGIAGAALATVISQWGLAVLITVHMKMLDPEYSLEMWKLRKEITGRVWKQFVRKGLPAGMQALFMSISTLLIQTVINGFGPDAIAGMTVYHKVEAILSLPTFAFGIALTGFVGQNLGARRPDRVRDSIKVSLRTVSLVVTPLSFFLVWISPLILGMFTHDAGILRNAHEAVVYTLPFYLFYSVNQILLGAVRGMGDTSYPMLSALVSFSVFRVLWCRLLTPLFPSMHTVYLSYDISYFIMLFMLAPRLLRMLRVQGAEGQ